MGVCDHAPLDSGPDLNGSEWPVMGVDWFMAQQYMAWLSEISGMPFRLPTEAEWEYAARGPNDLVYPWGAEIHVPVFNFCDVQCDRDGRDATADDGYAFTAPVGRYSPAGNSWVGAVDMAGNAWEWTSSLFQLYPYDPADGREAAADVPGERVTRGGGWANPISYLHAAYRGNREPDWRSNLQGFRVVSAVEPDVSGQVVYRIQPGDTLYAVAVRYGVTLEALMALNGITDPDRVYVSQRLIIPAPTETPPETSAMSADELALQRARDFQGGNEDWEAYVETFTFDNGVNIELALVPAGCFQMGNDPDAGEGAADGGQQCFDIPFWIGRTEVTNAEYELCVDAHACDGLGDLSADFNGPDQPVVGVNWFHALKYVEWLSEISGLSFSLPTEAEWEYAARGPDEWAYPWDGTTPSCDLMNYAFCAGHSTQVGSTSPAGNSWVGGADMAGNVWEWTCTLYQDYPYDPEDGCVNLVDSSNFRVARGGSWRDGLSSARAAYRFRSLPVNWDFNRGFRVVWRPPSP